MATRDHRDGGVGGPNPSVALETSRILRPRHLVEHVEVASAAPADRVFPPRTSDSFGVCLKFGPAHEVEADGKRLVYPRDSISVRPPGCVWSCTTPAGFLSIDVASELLPDGRLPGSMTFLSRQSLHSFAAALDALLHAGTKLRAEELVAQLLIAALDHAGAGDRAERTRRHDLTVGRARDFLLAHLGGRPTLDAIAATAGVDRFTLLRHFRRSLNTTPHRYLVMLRLDRARELLARGTSPGEAAHVTGFADQSHLTRWFRRAYGTTPAAYARDARLVHAAVSTAFKTRGDGSATVPGHGDLSSSPDPVHDNRAGNLGQDPPDRAGAVGSLESV